ncbi:MAG: cytochrome P450 [Hyphomicrobiaceae bacterium]|nr:cytochrome P450 [Hyphomicrobiaceae bacterium]
MHIAASSTQSIDLAAGKTFADGFPHSHFTWARAHAPIYWHEATENTPGGEGFWVMTRHEDCMAVMTDPETFSSDKGGRRTGGGTSLNDDRQAGAMLNFMDDPRHKRFRSLVNKGFSARAILALESELRRRAVSLIEAMPENEPFDFVARFSRDLPLQAICLLLGVPQGDRAQLAEWVDAGIAAPTQEVIAREYALKLRDYGLRLIKTKRGNLTDDVLSAIIKARLDPGEEGADGGPLTDNELVNFFILLFAAGAETTRSAIGGGLRALMDNQDQMARLRAADVAQLRVALEEILRWTTPSIYKRRTATRDVVYKGHRIREGDKITYWEMSANRDESVFEEPFRFDIARSPNLHIAFGFGAHVCLGASLARLEMRIAIQELLARIETFRTEGPIDWMPSNRLLGIRGMPISIRRRASHSPGATA